MFVIVTCPKCEAKVKVVAHGMRGRTVKCFKCQHFFKFVHEEKEEPKPKSALGEAVETFAVRIGLLAFYDKVKGWLPAVGILAGAAALVWLGIFFVRTFAPEAPLKIDDSGVEQKQASVKPPEIKPPIQTKTPQEIEAERAANDPLAYYRAKLKDPNITVRAKAAQALGSMGRDAEPALGDLLEAANHTHADVVAATEKALNAIGSPAKNNWHWVSQALRHKAKPPRKWALRLVAVPENADLAELPAVIASLNDPDPELSKLAATALTTLKGKDRKTVFATLFEDNSTSSKLYVTQRLSEPGQVTLADLPGLVKYLNEPNQDLQIAASKALDNYRPEDRKSVLLALAKEKGQAAPLYVASFLAKPDSGVVVETVPSLLEWLSAPSEELQKQSALALANFGPKHADKVRNNPQLLGQALRHKAEPARTWALQHLATPENVVLEELPTVINFLTDPNLKPLAEKALENFESKDRTTVIGRLFDEKTLTAKLYATQRLSVPGKVKLSDLPALVKCLDEPEPELHKHTIKALDNYASADRKFVLLALAKEENPSAKIYVASHMARPDGAVVPEAIAALLEWVSDANRELQQQAVLALYRIGFTHGDDIRAAVAKLGNDRAALVSDLKAFLDDPEAGLRTAAAGNLARLGREAGPALNQLMKALTDEEPAVRIHVTRALAALGKDLPGLAGYAMQVDETGARAIWSDGKHNSVSGMARLGNHYFVSLRNAATNDKAPAKIVILRSTAEDLEKWDQAMQFDAADGRDPQLLVVGGRLHAYWTNKETYVSTSQDGVTWTAAKVLDTQFAKVSGGARLQSLLRVRAAPDGACYSLARCANAFGQAQLLLLRSEDGVRFAAQHTFGAGVNKLLANLKRDGEEADLAFLETGTMVAAIDTGKSGVIAFSDPPYQTWHGFDTGINDLGGACLYKCKFGVLLGCRSPAKQVNGGAACAVYSVGPTALTAPQLLPNSSVAGCVCLAAGLTENEPLLIFAKEDSGAANLYLSRLNIRATKISLLAK